MNHKVPNMTPERNPPARAVDRAIQAETRTVLQALIDLLARQVLRENLDAQHSKAELPWAAILTALTMAATAYLTLTMAFSAAQLS